MKRVWIGAALLVGLSFFLVWLWSPEHQVRRHTENLFARVEAKDWAGVAKFLSDHYADQWQHDRELLVTRLHLVFAYVGDVRISAGDPSIVIDQARATWRGKITLSGEDSEIMALIKDRVNSLPTPFELEWSRASAKPWDWKLVRVSNTTLEIPQNFE